MHAIVLLLAMLPQANVRNISLAWDAMPTDQAWTEVRLYEKKLDGTYLQLGKVGCQAGPPIVCPATLTMSFADKLKHDLIVRSYDGTMESDDSNMVTVPAGPTPPGHFRRQ